MTWRCRRLPCLLDRHPRRYAGLPVAVWSRSRRRHLRCGTRAVRFACSISAPARPVRSTWKADPQWTLSGLAPHPKFAENKLLYLVETPASRDSMLRLSRYREVGGVLGERAVLLETRVELDIRSNVGFFESDGYLSVALLSSAPPPIDDRHPSQRTISPSRHRRRFAAPGNPTGFRVWPISAPTPMRWHGQAVTARRGYSRGCRRDCVHGDAARPAGRPTRTVCIRRPCRSPCRSRGSGNQQVLYITGSRGDVRRLARDGTGWSVRDGFRLFDNARSIRDALVLSDGEVAACGPVNGSGYGVWRVRLP